MAITREFRVQEDENSGYVGFKPMWFDNATPGRGEVCAHDILEHFRRQTSPLEGEAEAIGACIFLRVEPGVLGPTGGAKTVSAEVGGMLRDFLYSEGALQLPTTKASRPLESSWVERFLVDAVKQGIAEAWREYTYDTQGMDEDRLAELRQAVLAPAVADAFVYWIRRGYRRAARRYHDSDACTVGGYLFDRIGKSLDDLLNRVEDIPGLQVRVSVQPRYAKFNVKVREDFRESWRDVEDYLM